MTAYRETITIALIKFLGTSSEPLLMDDIIVQGNFHPSTVRGHIVILGNLGLIERFKVKGNQLAYTLSQEGREFLDKRISEIQQKKVDFFEEEFNMTLGAFSSFTS